MIVLTNCWGIRGIKQRTSWSSSDLSVHRQSAQDWETCSIIMAVERTNTTCLDFDCIFVIWAKIVCLYLHSTTAFEMSSQTVQVFWVVCAELDWGGDWLIGDQTQVPMAITYPWPPNLKIELDSRWMEILRASEKLMALFLNAILN